MWDEPSHLWTLKKAADEQEVKELNLLYKQLQKLIEDQDQFKSTLEEI